MSQRITTVISPDLLDTIGRQFRFKHTKGTAEWLKNALDHYLRLREQGQELRQGNWPVIVCLCDGISSKPGPNLAVIDFGGTTLDKIQDFFLHWGDRSAATHGRALSTANVTGGHGNGGKFYMREMFKAGSRLLTWRNGRATSLIVDKQRRGETGEWEFQDRLLNWREALASAMPESEGLYGADYIITHLEQSDHSIITELNEGRRGLTVVIGRRAEQMLSSNDIVIGKRWNAQMFVDELRDAPQARRPIRELSISVFCNGELKLERLSPETIEEDPDWSATETSIPASVLGSGHEDETHLGVLQLRKAISPLTGRNAHQNRVFVIDAFSNPVASYMMRELPWPGHSTLISLFQGELLLDFPELENLIANDRERLTDSPIVTTILRWVAEQIWQHIRLIEEKQKAERNLTQLQVASVLNDTLNQHAQRFLREVQTEILVDVIRNTDSGGPADPIVSGDQGMVAGPGGGPREGENGSPGNGPGPGRGDIEDIQSERTGGTGSYRSMGGGQIDTPGTSRSTRRPRFPQVLLSEFDANPADANGEPKSLSEGHPPLYQDDEDKIYNVWWINTRHPYATSAMSHGGPKGSAFKNYQLFMFRDVVQRETLRLVQQREAELGLDRVETELDEMSNRFLAELPYDLITELLGGV